jgi:tetratricopeptide (TPR) repeat protein
MMSRKVWKRCVASAALTLIALGLGWGWTNWRGRPELLAQGISAYADHDYRRAAEVARDRLKAAPADTHALRLLARATARLGRDGPANALFSRLGSSALQPEDLFLLGLGLNRAGQKESAERVWEKGLALEPDHAETIEQLIGRYAAQNRLAEAAELAERLTRQTGWELRGELFLSTFRAEMSDPAGAAVVLERALERPEFLRLNRTATIHYRELLARSLLKIERPKEAREVLQKVLQYGERPEASWLLSRAALQDGAIPESIAALGSAGSYRSEHPLELEPGPYVGEARCAPCHHDKGRAVQANRHNSTLVRGKPLAELPYPQGSVPDPDDPTVTHRFRLEGDKVHLETRARDQVWKAVVDYAFGSPRRYFSLVGHNDQGSPYIFRLSHYQSSDDSGWVRTTGHSTDPRGDQNFLGKAIDVRDGIYSIAPGLWRLTGESVASAAMALAAIICGRLRRSSRTWRLSIRRRRRPRGGFVSAVNAIAITKNCRWRAPIQSRSGSPEQPSPGAVAILRAPARLIACPVTTHTTTTIGRRRTITRDAWPAIPPYRESRPRFVPTVQIPRPGVQFVARPVRSDRPRAASAATCRTF